MSLMSKIVKNTYRRFLIVASKFKAKICWLFQVSFGDSYDIRKYNSSLFEY